MSASDLTLIDVDGTSVVYQVVSSNGTTLVRQWVGAPAGQEHTLTIRHSTDPVKKDRSGVPLPIPVIDRHNIRIHDVDPTDPTRFITGNFSWAICRGLSYPAAAAADQFSRVSSLLVENFNPTTVMTNNLVPLALFLGGTLFI